MPPQLLVGSNTEASNQLCRAVAVSGDGSTIAVAALSESSNATGVNGPQTQVGAANSGAVYLFAQLAAGANFTQQAYVKATNTKAGNFFGYSVALSDSGNTLAIGALFESGIGQCVGAAQFQNSSGQSSGAVYIYSRSGALGCFRNTSRLVMRSLEISLDPLWL